MPPPAAVMRWIERITAQNKTENWRKSHTREFFDLQMLVQYISLVACNAMITIHCCVVSSYEKACARELEDVKPINVSFHVYISVRWLDIVERSRQ